MKKLFALLLAVLMMMSFAITVSAEGEIVENDPIVIECEIGDTITFGSYGDEAIEWLVLDKQEDQIFVLSQYALDCKPYHSKHENVTWETCSLRQWLNDEFYNTAFSDAEKALIPLTTVTADSNPDYRTNTGNDTQDHVFLLSIDEVKQYLNKETKSCTATYYAESKGSFVGSTGYCWWWLRTPGHSQQVAAGVRVTGSIATAGDDVVRNNASVRPAMWITLPKVPEEPVTPDTPDIPDVPEEPEEPDVPADSPATGDNSSTYIIGAAILLVLSAGVVALTAKKRA